MSAVNTTGLMAFTAGEDILKVGTRVKLSSGNIVKAAAADLNGWIGTVIEPIVSGNQGTVRLRNSPGSRFFVASAAIASGAVLWATDAGCVDDADPGSGSKIGYVALEAATAANDTIEAIEQPVAA